MDASAVLRDLPLSEIRFDNTEVAFAGRSNTDLRRAWWLFRMIGKPALVKIGKPLTRLAFSLGLPVAPAIRATLFKQFVGGETIAECEKTLADLAAYGISSILDYSAEGQANEAGFEQTRDEILKILDRSEKDERIPFAVFKPTGLARPELLEKASRWDSLSPGEEAELAQFRERVEAICRKALAVGTPVLIDAEESWLQPVCDRIALAMMQKYNRSQAWVWNTLQMYRCDRLAYLQDLLSIAAAEGFQLGLKLVRGAYMEKERDWAMAHGISSPIHASKAGTDQAFDGAVSLCLEHLERVAFCCGSHNEASNDKLMNSMADRGIARDDRRVWFAQLLGMSDHISYNLARAGYNVAKYVPYAPIRDLVPYLMRRAEENTSVAGQSSRELDLLQREMQRRKLL